MMIKCTDTIRNVMGVPGRFRVENENHLVHGSMFYCGTAGLQRVACFLNSHSG